jgi:hypothetical protein
MLSDSHHLLSFSFTEVSLLGWLVIGIAPWLLYRWQQRESRQIAWGAMRFIQAAVTKQQRRINWKQWLLLVLRTAILVGIVLAAAGPVWRSFTPLLLSEQRTHFIICIDQSGSMSAPLESGNSRWTELHRQLQTIASKLNPGDACSLIQVGTTAELLTTEPLSQVPELSSLIQQLELSDGVADWNTALRLVVECARKQHTTKRFSQQNLLIFSDLQSADWEFLNSSTGSEIAQRLESFLDQGTVRLYDAGTASRENLSITGVSLPSKPPVINSDLTYLVTIKNWGDTARQCELRLSHQQQRIEQATLTIAAQQELTIPITTRWTQPGDYGLQFTIHATDWLVDNHWYVIQQIVERQQHLIVHGDFDPRSVQALSLAINPAQGQLNEANQIQVDIVHESQWSNKRLADYQLIWFNNVSGVNTTEAQLIRDYLDQSGSTIWWLGPRTQPADFAAMSAGPTSSWPVSIKQLAPPGNYHWELTSPTHPLLRLLGPNTPAKLDKIPYTRYVQLQTTPMSAWPVNTVKYGTFNDPAFVAQSNSEAGVVIFTVPCNLESEASERWTLLPALPAFHPLIQETIAWSQRTKHLSRQQEVGNTLSGPWSCYVEQQQQFLLSSALTNSIATPISLNLEPHPQRKNIWRWTFANTERAGVYQFQSSPENKTLHAVNYPLREANPSRWEPSILPKNWEMLNSFESLQTNQSRAQSGSVSQTLLCLVLVLMLIEGWLATHLSKGLATDA